MKKEEIISLLYHETETIKASLPDMGRRFEVLGYIITQDMWDCLMLDKEFADSFYKGNPNIGGITVQIGDKVEVKYIQHQKGQKWFGEER